jgi:hypothetical protein
MMPPARAPDLVRPVIGFRQWRLRGSELWALLSDERWDPGVVTARCDTGRHQAPETDCECGLYAWYEPPNPMASAATADLVAGGVALWGRIELHAHGMRAEHGMVVALALPLSWGSKRRRLRAAAERLGAPAVPVWRLKATALHHGELIPPAMRPPDTTTNLRAQPFPPDPARLHAAIDGYPPGGEKTGNTG